MDVFTYMSTGLELQRRRLAAAPPCRLAVAGAALAEAADDAAKGAFEFNRWISAVAEFIAMATAECSESGPIDIEYGAAEGSDASAVCIATNNAVGAASGTRSGTRRWQLRCAALAWMSMK